MLNRFTYLTLIFSVMMGLGACNTMEGAGEDVERVGEEVSGAAE